jgi:hypothetical protein
MRKSTIIKNKFNVGFFVIFYILLALGVGFVGYLVFINYNEFYIDGDRVDVNINEEQTVKVSRVDNGEVKEGDYIFSIEDSSVATIDKDGNIVALKEGETNIVIKYKYSIFTKKFPISVKEEEIKEE